MRISSSNNFGGKISRAARGERKPVKLPPAPEQPIMNYVEVKYWLAHIKNDHWWQTQMPISYAALSDAVGIERKTFVNMIENKRTYRDVFALKALAPVIISIEKREVCFPEVKNSPLRGAPPIPRLLRVMPRDPVPLISRLSQGSAWSLWATCFNCRNNKFLPIIIDHKPYVACYHCLPPSQYRAIGAAPVMRSLIHEVLRAFY